MILRVIQCPDWHAGQCRYAPSVERFGARPSAGVCARACGRGTLTGETIATPRQSNGATFLALWTELHTSAPPNAAWLAAFAARVPCGECCAHTLAWIASGPDTSSADAWFAATVAFHNSVNARLAKPPMSLDAARSRWRA